MTTLVNINHKRGGLPPEYDVYIGRAGKGMSGYFGNPPEHLLGGVGKDTIIARYKEYFYRRISEDNVFRQRVAELKGKRLGCFCVPSKCHGMVIIEYLEGISIDEQMKILNPPKVHKEKTQKITITDIFEE